MIKHMRRWLVLAAAALAVLAAGGVAWASIPDSSGVIHACYQSPPPAGGASLQVIDTANGGKCSGGHVELTWNQAGPAGPQGPAGATGATGPQGPAGPPGPGTAFDFGKLSLTNNVGQYQCQLSSVGGPDAATLTVTASTNPNGCILSGITLAANPLGLFVPSDSSTQIPTSQNDGIGAFFLTVGTQTTVSFIILP